MGAPSVMKKNESTLPGDSPLQALRSSERHLVTVEAQQHHIVAAEAIESSDTGCQRYWSLASACKLKNRQVAP